jgi:PAS domain S-box-containing protein
MSEIKTLGSSAPVDGRPFDSVAARPQPNILLVDDQPARLLTYEAVLSGVGVNCVRALSGAEALEKLLNHEFAVLLLDVHMPGMDGFELARLIREHPRLERTPIIFVTAVHVTEMDQLKGYEVGAIDYISVPIVPEILRSKVALLVELHQRRRELAGLNQDLQEARAQLEKEHAKAIEAREAQLRAVFEHPDQLTIVIEAERDESGAIKDFVYRNANSNALRSLGFAREDVVGRPLSEVLPERAERAIGLCTQVLETREPVRYEARFVDRNFQITLYPAFNDAVISSGVDVTERKQADQALRDSQERLLLAKSAAQLGIFDWEARTGLVQWDERTYELWGVKSNEPVTHETFLAGVHPEDRDGAQQAIDKALDASGDGRFAAIFRVMNCADGLTRWVEASGRAFADNGHGIRLIGTVQDVTGRRLAEESLRKSEERFRELANNINQFAWTCDELGKVTWYNDRWYEYTGATFEDMRGEGWRKIQHPAHVERVATSLRVAVANGKPWEDTFPLRGKDGNYRWFLSRAVPIHDEKGKVVRWFGTNTDVTESRRLQEALEEADRRKDEFLAMLAHELRNPLAPIRSAAEVLERLLAHDESTQSLVAMIQRQGAHLSRMLDDLLDVARITQGHIELRRETLPVRECIESVLETVQSLMRIKNHRLTFAQTSERIYVNADKVRLEQCVANLLTNAAKYTEPGGDILVRSYAQGGEAVIEIIDTGIGIAADFLPRVFELFAQSDRSLDRSEGGLGIGLSVCKRLIEMHGGSVSCFSEGAGHGATFTIRLPLMQEPADWALPCAGAAEALQRVLIVDDNRDAADSLAMCLQIEGHQTKAVYSAESALEQVVAFRPKTVILDIGLPGMDGYEAARRIKAMVRSVRLIALSGYGQEQDKERSAAAGFDLHLIKPTDIDTLSKALAMSARPGDRVTG